MEFKTAQMDKIAKGKKILPHEYSGRVRVLAGKMPDQYETIAVGNTIIIGQMPVNSRILGLSLVSCAAGTASAKLNIGLREFDTGTVIDEDGIAAGLDIATAGVKSANTGAMVTGGDEYITKKTVDVFATVTGAAVAANQKIKFEIFYVVD